MNDHCLYVKTSHGDAKYMLWGMGETRLEML